MDIFIIALYVVNIVATLVFAFVLWQLFKCLVPVLKGICAGIDPSTKLPLLFRLSPRVLAVVLFCVFLAVAL